LKKIFKKEANKRYILVQKKIKWYLLMGVLIDLLLSKRLYD